MRTGIQSLAVALAVMEMVSQLTVVDPVKLFSDTVSGIMELTTTSLMMSTF